MVQVPEHSYKMSIFLGIIVSRLHLALSLSPCLMLKPKANSLCLCLCLSLYFPQSHSLSLSPPALPMSVCFSLFLCASQPLSVSSSASLSFCQLPLVHARTYARTNEHTSTYAGKTDQTELSNWLLCRWSMWKVRDNSIISVVVSCVNLSNLSAVSPALQGA